MERHPLARTLPVSYYEATAARTPEPFAPLAGRVEADLCVVGGGVTGLSTALHAARAGFSVVLLEARRVGFGASGRNGGQMIPSLRKSAVDLVRRYGAAQARRIFDVVRPGRDLLVDLVREHAIDCDLKLTGHLTVAHRPGEEGWMNAEARCLAETMDYPHTRVLGREALAAEVGSARYHGAFLDEMGGHLHPLNFTLGLARATAAAGAKLYEDSAVIAIDDGKDVRVRTEAGWVRARHAVLACDALIGTLAPRLANRIMPIGSYVLATEPLSDYLAQALIPQDRAISDSKFAVDYYRLTQDRRLLFGGGERYTARQPRDIAHFVRRYMLRVFPQLDGTKIDFGWGGLVSITRTRLPHFGRSGNIAFAHGYSGQGVIMSVLAGKLLADALAGDTSGFDTMAELAPPAFPGGILLRHQLHLGGMLWYAMRDRVP